MSAASPFLMQLQKLLAGYVFPLAFGDSLPWSAVHRFECSISRKRSTIRVESVTFWMEENGDGTAMTFDNDDAQWKRAVRSYLTNAALTAATGNDGNVACIIGYAPTKQEVDAIMDEHIRNGFEAPVGTPSERGKSRRANRRGRERRAH